MQGNDYGKSGILKNKMFLYLTEFFAGILITLAGIQILLRFGRMT